ncbi:MAG: hypothetical protein ACI85F_002743 [Bacteroidia bacterium]|jgi:hypothetical protein
MLKFDRVYSLAKDVLVVVVLIHSITLPSSCIAQKPDKNFFNKKWVKVESNRYYFYRIVSVEGSITVIKDFSRSGKLQFEGKWEVDDSLQSFITNQGIPTLHGRIDKATWYKNGNVTKETVYLPNGTPVDTTKDVRSFCTQYFKWGKAYDWPELNGKKHGTMQWYHIGTGEVYVTMDYKDGVKHGKEIMFYRDRSIHMEVDYVNGQKHGKDSRYYRYPDRPKQIRVYENGKLFSKKKFDILIDWD